MAYTHKNEEEKILSGIMAHVFNSSTWEIESISTMSGIGILPKGKKNNVVAHVFKMLILARLNHVCVFKPRLI